MSYNISKVTVILEVWDSNVPYGPGLFYKRRISFDVPPEDVAFYDLAHERWTAFSDAMWAGGPQFNEVSQDGL